MLNSPRIRGGASVRARLIMSSAVVNKRNTLLLTKLTLCLILIVLSAACTPSDELLDSAPAVSAPGARLELEYTMRLSDGSEVAGGSDLSTLLMTIGNNDVFPALEQALTGLSVGEQGSVRLTAEQAYGARNEDALRVVARDLLPEEAAVVGTVVLAEDDTGEHSRVTVREVRGETVVLDLNHPLAGKDLTIEFKIARVLPPDEPSK